MAKYENLNSLFTDIAGAIREKTGKSENIVAENFPEEIRNIEQNNNIITGVSVLTIGNRGMYDVNNIVIENIDLEDGFYLLSVGGKGPYTNSVSDGSYFTSTSIFEIKLGIINDILSNVVHDSSHQGYNVDIMYYNRTLTAELNFTTATGAAGCAYTLFKII